MNLRVRRVQEVFDILATTLWVVTAPRKEGVPARLRGPLLVLCFPRSRSPPIFSVSDRIDELSPVILSFPPYNPVPSKVKIRSVAIWPW